ncbi:MAG: thioredoxin domain-containing protein [Microbacteriaceae bacterium]
MAENKHDRREHAREIARQMREAERRRRLRGRIILQSSVGVVILAIVAVVVVVIVNSTASAGPGPKNMASGGIEFIAAGDGSTVQAVRNNGATDAATLTPTPLDTTDGVVQVVSYIDWACPVCQEFEASYSEELTSLVAAGTISLEVHPVAILDRSFNSSRYSSRAANAAACVANYDPDQFLDVQTQFYDNQPEEGTDGLDDDAIIALVSAGGVDDDSVTSCIEDETFKDWVTAATDAVTSDSDLADPDTGYFGTPTIVVNGERLSDASTVLDAISTAAASETTTTG